MSTERTSIAFSALPDLGDTLDAGTFAGIITRHDGSHHAVVLLPEKASDLTWQAAMDWAAAQDAQLPSRPVASLLFANLSDKLDGEWHWTSEQSGASYAWYCGFDVGDVDYHRKSYEGSAVAVRLIPLTA